MNSYGDGSKRPAKEETCMISVNKVIIVLGEKKIPEGRNAPRMKGGAMAVRQTELVKKHSLPPGMTLTIGGVGDHLRPPFDEDPKLSKTPFMPPAKKQKITSNKVKKEPVKPVKSNVEIRKLEAELEVLMEELPEDIINFLKRDHFDQWKPSE
ncbi:unnamed protein product [Fraxinus pennsylvanica]|uniref:Uncharacterized protein n=1 Tax=Fraxinus pennsylvanica TaxID=56036 RepID=A0AAD1YMA0_9LAMI|nr:unnamed protein product [Fraxinus pennsylvanica]